MVNLTDEIISVSEKTKKDLQRLKQSEKSVVIPNGIDFKEITEISPSAGKSDVIFAGRLIKDKNVDLLMKSLVDVKKELPDIKCFIVGDGPERSYLESLRDDLNLIENIKFLGFTEDHDGLISYMKASRVFVLPSTREGFGMVVLEANACGLPVVVVDYPMSAAKDLITDGKNGFLAEFSSKSLADKIIEGLKKKEMMRDSCMEFASGYDWDEIVVDLEGFYRKVLNSD